MNIHQALNRLVRGRDLSFEEMHDVMRIIMTGDATSAQIGGFLIALRMKGESLDEITGAAEVMRELVNPVSVDIDNLVDTCGTGGDGSNLFNVSTASAFVVAAAGGHVAKHGNRSVSSSTGSADVLEQAGINLSIPVDQITRAIEQVGVGFMFAPAHHSAMKHAIGPRRELGLRTIFNMLGPMTNPAGVRRQVLGVFDKDLCLPMAKVLQRLGSEHVMIVHALDGLDEISVCADTYVAELKDGIVDQYTLSPAQFRVNYDDLSGLSVSSAEESLALINSAFSGEVSATAQKARDMIKVNAGAAIYVSGVALSLDQGVDMAEDAIDSGAAKQKLKELAEFTAVVAQ